MADISRLWQLVKDAASNESRKWGNSPKLMDLLMRDRSTQGIRDYAGNVQQRGATLAGLLQGREPTNAQKALFSGLDPTTDEGAMNFALTFAGPMAKTANLAKLKIAEQMKAQGVPDTQIHKATGWFFGMADGKPRFEIPDNGADFGGLGFKKLKNGIDALPLNGIGTEQVFTHPDFARAYPDMHQNLDVALWADQAPGGHFSGSDSYGQIRLNTGNKTREGMTSTGLHELQHAIQQREGWAMGGSPDSLRQLVKIDNMMQGKPAPTDADVYNAYRRLAGEAEARLTQARMSMTPEQRIASYPPSMFDVPVEQQIVRGLLGEDTGKAMSLPAKTKYELAHELAQRNAALPVEQGGLGLPANNTAMDRAKAMGFDIEYGMLHGGSPDISEFDINQLGKTTRAKSAEGGIFTTDIPKQADFYAIAAAERKPFEAELKRMAKGKTWEDIANSIGVNPRSILAKDRVDFIRNHASEAGVDSMSEAADKVRYLHSGGLPKPIGGETVYPLYTRYDDPIEMQFGEASQKYGGMPGIIEAAKKSNKPHLLLKNVTEGGNNALWDVHFNPSNIRSRFAAFDPMKRDSADLLAGVAPWAVPAALASLLYRDEQNSD